MIAASSSATARPRLMGRDILKRFKGVYGVTLADLRGHSRRRDIVLVRMAAMYWIRRRTSLSLPQIGQLFGGKDHTTVLHAIQTYPKKRQAMNVRLRPFGAPAPKPACKLSPQQSELVHKLIRAGDEGLQISGVCVRMGISPVHGRVLAHKANQRLSPEGWHINCRESRWFISPPANFEARGDQRDAG